MASLDIINFGVGHQSAIDTPATTMTALIIADGEGRIENNVNFQELKTHGAAWGTGFYPDVFHGEAEIPLKVASIDNGMGDILTSVFTESVAGGVQPEGASTTKNHRFTAPLAPKGEFLTIWGQYQTGDGNTNADVLMDAIMSKLSIKWGSPSDPLLTAVATMVGSHVEDEDGDDFSGTAWASALGAIVNLSIANQCKQLRRQDAFLYVADDAAEINTRFGGMTFDIDLNVNTGDEAFKPAGRDYAFEACMGKGCSAVLKFTGDVESPEDFRFPWGSAASGTCPEDTYAYQQPCPGYVPVTFGCWGPSIEKVVETPAREIAATGSPTNLPTPGGTYTGDKTLTYYVEVTTVGTLDPDSPGEFKWWTVEDLGDGGATSAETTEVAMTGAAQTLSNGVTITWTATAEGCTIADQYAFVAGNYRHGFKVTIPYAQVTQVKKKHGDRLGSEWEIKAFAPPGTAPFTIDWQNTLATAYDA